MRLDQKGRARVKIVSYGTLDTAWGRGYTDHVNGSVPVRRSAVSTAVALWLLLPAANPGFAAQAESAAGREPKVVRWVVAHDRGNSAFTELIEGFARRIDEKSGGRMRIEFIHSKAPESELDAAAYKQVLDGAADMSQLAASGANVHVFDMPFVFRSYEHAEAVFNGPVGKKLLGSVSAASQGRLRGFGFTYSGGYRILAGKAAIRRVGDFKGVRIRRSTSHLAGFMSDLGAELTDAGPASRENPVADAVSGRVDLEETEVNRLAIARRERPEMVGRIGFVNLTRHRMYVTALVANERFLSGLPARLRRLLRDELEALAVAERKLSVGLEAGNQKVLADAGLRLIEFPESARGEFIRAGTAYRGKFPEFDGLVREIQAVKEFSSVVAHK